MKEVITLSVPKCPYCGGEMDVGGDDIFGYNCICTFCGSSSPQRATLEEAYAAAMKREHERGEWVHRKARHPLPWDCPPYYGEEYDRESHSCLEDEWHCSNCDYETDDIDKEWWNFCPNCGAEMMRERKQGEANE